MQERKSIKIDFWEKQWQWDVLTPLIIILTSVSLYVHTFFSNKETTFKIFNFTYEHHFYSNDGFMWFVLSCTTPIILFSIWYFKSNYFKKHYILIPIAVFIYDLFWRILFIQLPNQWINRMICILITSIIIGLFLYIDKIRKDRQLKNNKILFDLELNELYDSKSKGLHRKLKEWILSLESEREGMSKDQYLNKLYYAQRVLEEDGGLFFTEQVSSRRNRKLFERISVIIFITIPIWYILSELIPIGTKFFDLGWLFIHDFGFQDVSTFVWYLNFKNFVLFPLMIWFISSRNWWRYAILVPIILYTYQVWETLKAESNLVDQFELFKAAPAILFIVGLLLVISYFVKYRYKMFDAYLDLTNEIDGLIEQQSIANQVIIENKTVLENLKQDKTSDKTDTEKMEALINLKKSLMAELEKKK